MFFFNDKKINLLERSLDAAALRQKVIANNIANVDTPNFKRSYVQFEEFLTKEMNKPSGPIHAHRTDARHIPFSNEAASNSQAMISTDESSAVNNNNNNVDIDYEMSLMAKNQLRYNMMIDRTSSYFKSIRQAIDGR